MARSTSILLLLFATTMVLLTACGAAQEPTSQSALEIDTATKASGPSISEQKSKRGRPHISTAGDEIRFDRAKLKETALFKVRLTFTIASAVNQHIWVLVKKVTQDEVAAAAVDAGAANSWIPPNDDRILAHTGLLDPGETEEITFALPWPEHINSFVPPLGTAPSCSGVFLSFRTIKTASLALLAIAQREVGRRVDALGIGIDVGFGERTPPATFLPLDRDDVSRPMPFFTSHAPPALSAHSLLIFSEAVN